MPRGEWISVPIPKFLVKKVDEIVEKNKYPMGDYHSRSDFIVRAIKDKVEKESTSA